MSSIEKVSYRIATEDTGALLSDLSGEELINELALLFSRHDVEGDSALASRFRMQLWVEAYHQAGVK